MPPPGATILEVSAYLGLEVRNGDFDRARAILFWQCDGRSAFHEPPDELVAAARKMRVINLGATDISKTNVARSFEDVFGYPLLLDPRTHLGPAVEKPEGNGLRTGRIVECPREPRPGFCYQRLVDNRLEARERTLDLRVSVFCRETPMLLRKERSLKSRLGDVIEPHLPPTVHRPDEVLSSVEISRLVELARKLGADYCEIDCLRDRSSGLLYAVDVNTTPTWFEGFEPKVAETLVRIQAEAFREVFIKVCRASRTT